MALVVIGVSLSLYIYISFHVIFNIDTFHVIFNIDILYLFVSVELLCDYRQQRSDTIYIFNFNKEAGE